MLWARSYGYRDAVEFDRDGARWGIESVDGRLVLSDAPQRNRDAEAARAAVRAARDELDWTYAQYRLLPDDERAEMIRLIQFIRQTSGKRRAAMARQSAVMAAPVNARSGPHALPAVAFGLLPAAWLAVQAKAGRRYRWRRAANLCPACGYDLRGTPSGCPECGPIPAVRNVGLSGRQVAFVFVSALLAAAGLYALAATTARPTTAATATPATSRSTGPSARTTRSPPAQIRVAPATATRTKSWPPDEMDRMKAYFELRDLSGGTPCPIHVRAYRGGELHVDDRLPRGRTARDRRLPA